MKKAFTITVTIAFLLLISAVASADVMYTVSVNTSSVSGTSGYLDFQLAPGSSVLPATATVSDFVPQAGVGSAVATGDSNGTLNPGPLTLGNSTAFNDFYVAFTYGNSLSFNVTLSGAAINSPDPVNFPDASSFAFSLFDSTGANPLLTGDPTGFAFTIDLNGDGTQTINNFSDFASVTVSQPQPPGVPEPNLLPVLSIVLAGMGTFRPKLNL